MAHGWGRISTEALSPVKGTGSRHSYFRTESGRLANSHLLSLREQGFPAEQLHLGDAGRTAPAVHWGLNDGCCYWWLSRVLCHSCLGPCAHATSTPGCWTTGKSLFLQDSGSGLQDSRNSKHLVLTVYRPCSKDIVYITTIPYNWRYNYASWEKGHWGTGLLDHSSAGIWAGAIWLLSLCIQPPLYTLPPEAKVREGSFCGFRARTGMMPFAHWDWNDVSLPWPLLREQSQHRGKILDIGIFSLPSLF